MASDASTGKEATHSWSQPLQTMLPIGERVSLPAVSAAFEDAGPQKMPVSRIRVCHKSLAKSRTVRNSHLGRLSVYVVF